MPPLTEEAFTVLVDAGCPDCPGKRLAVEALVAQRLALLGGEPYGAPSWAYKGEDLVRGTYRISCEGCKRELFTATACPQCDAPDGVEKALTSENAFLLPRECATCGSEQLVAISLLPALVVYEGKRANKARARAGPDDPGFHAVRIECARCHGVVQPRTPCPLCTKSL
jgi:Zn ribbon nucleic-acid-binding protein